MSWLHEFVHKVNRIWLVLANNFAPTSKHIVSLETTILLIPIIQCPPDNPTSLLFNHNKKSEELYHPTRKPPEAPVAHTLRIEIIRSTNSSQEYIPRIKAPCEHVSLGYLTYLNK